MQPVEVAVETRELGRTGEAAQLWTALDHDATRLLGEHDPFTNDTRWNRAEAVAAAGDVALGLRLLTEVIDGRAAIYGPDHPRTIAIRLDLAGSLGETKQFSQALTLATEITNDCVRIFGHDHEFVLAGRHQQALWTALSGHVDDATARLTTLLHDCEQILGPEHPLTRDCANQLAQPDHAIWYYLPPTW